MGIKALKDELDCGYIITVDSKGNINLGNSYQYAVISITKDYDINPTREKLHAKSAEKTRSDLIKLKESGKLKELIEQEDKYESLTDVFTFSDGKVFKQKCEVFGYPNVTTCGSLMYDNTHFLTRKEALFECRREELAGFKNVILWQLIDCFYTAKKVFKRLATQTFYLFRSYVLFGV